MTWPSYLGCFFSGMFLTNALPHFITGLCGDRFPTPFAKPPGIGLSSSTVNVAWGLLNILVGSVLFYYVGLQHGRPTAFLVFFAGMAAISIMLSTHFTKKHSG